MLTTLVQRAQNISFLERTEDVVSQREKEAAFAAAEICPFPLRPLRSAEGSSCERPQAKLWAGVWSHSPPQAGSLLSQGAARKLGNSRVWQLLAQGKGSEGSGLPGGPPGRPAGCCCHSAHHRPDRRGTVAGPGGGLRAMRARCPHSAQMAGGCGHRRRPEPCGLVDTHHRTSTVNL